jgi:hypothetical protein
MGSFQRGLCEGKPGHPWGCLLRFGLHLFMLSMCIVGNLWAIGGPEILPLSLRSVPETDALLSSRYYDIDGFYSFRPPSAWRRVTDSPRGTEKDPWRYRALFSDASKKSSLETGVFVGGPSAMDKESLSKYLGDFSGELRRGGLNIESSGVYLYDRYHCFLIRGSEKRQSVLWFLVFGEGSVREHLRMVVRYGAAPSKGFERMIECVFASVRWPDLRKGQENQRNPFPETER